MTSRQCCRRLLVGFAVVVAPGLASCRGVTAPTEQQVRLQVAADSVACVGAHGPQRCLSIRQLVGGDAWGGWQPFFGSIEGFTHEPGFVYDLLAARRVLRDPPADGSAYTYRLIELLSKTSPSA